MFGTVQMDTEQQRNSYRCSWLENWISRTVFEINSHIWSGQEGRNSRLFRGAKLFRNKYNYLKDKLEILLLLYNYFHFLTSTTEMGKDGHSRSHETTRICSSRFHTWEAAERFRQQTKKNQAVFIVFPWNNQALMQILLFCFFALLYLAVGISLTLEYLRNTQKWNSSLCGL